MTPELLAELLKTIFKDLWIDIALLALVAGACGSLLSNAIFSVLDRQIEKQNFKRRVAAWKARQDLAKAEQGAQLSGDDGAGRACETGTSGNA